MNRSNTKNRAFTIVELLIVIVVVGILAALVIVAYNGIQDRSRAATLQSTLSQYAKKLETYKLSNNDTYPVDLATADLSSTASTATYNYQASGSSYCLSATINTTSYKVTNLSQSPQSGTCSGVLSNGTVCPTNFIVVPANTALGTSEFCVAKYEMKITGQANGNQTYSAAFVPESRADGTPWVNITQTNAISEASTVAGCTGCHLMTEAEWMAIAANVLSVASNWSGGAVGSGYIYQGHINNSPSAGLDAPTDDSDGLYGMTGGLGGAGTNNRRTLTLTNGEVIWDFSGNLWEWTSTSQAMSNVGVSGDSAFNSREWTLGTLSLGNLPTVSRPSSLASVSGLASVTSWNSTNGIGRANVNYSDTGVRGFLRGGAWTSTGGAGVLAISLNSGVGGTSNNFGFRSTK